VIRRGKRAVNLCTGNWPILIHFSYCLVSVSWTYFPDIAFKRWIKAISDLALVLVILTDGQPVAAVRRLISRVGFISMPISVLLTKYYGELGRAYTVDGDLMEYWRNNKQKYARPHSVAHFAWGAVEQALAVRS
jgi:hypothetical protein